MATSPRGNESGNPSDPVIAPVPYPDITRAVAAIVAAIGDLKNTIDAHRNTLEQLTARVNGLVPPRQTLDASLVQSFTLLERNFSLASNGSAAQPQTTERAVNTY
jgi:hypothetical protein